MSLNTSRFKKGHEGHCKGKTKNNYEPLRKISEKLTGIKRSEETKEKLRNRSYTWGYKVSATKKERFKNGKLKIWNKNVTGEEYKKHLKNGKVWNKGKHHSEETKKKISNALKKDGMFKGDLNPAKRPEVGKKISKALKGRDNYWLRGKKRPEHSKFMKEHIKEFKGDGFGVGSPHYSHSKLHDKVKLVLNLISGYNFESEIHIGKFWYDEVDENKKVIIEINGDKNHANPNVFKENEHPSFFDRSLTSKQIWEFDLKKKKYAEENGYKVIYIWESFFAHTQRTLFISWLQKELERRS